MTCEIQRPDPQILFNRLRDMFSNTVLQGGQVIPESNEWYVVSLEYAVAEEFYAISEQQWKERDPRTACCDNLINIAAADGVFLRAATFAQGYIELTGTAGAALPSSIQVNIGGNTYQSVTVLPAAMPADGRTVVRIRAQEAGEQGNGQVAATGALVDAIAGVDDQVTVYGGTFCGGQDAETCEQFRSRYIARKQFSPRATQAWIEDKLLEWPCVTRVCARSGVCCTLAEGSCNCGGQLQYYVLMDNTFDCGIPPRCVLDEIQEWMFGPEGQEGYGVGQVEVGVCGSIHSITPALIDVTISEYGCISNAQKNLIREQMAEYFTTLCPSTELNQRHISTIIGSVLGSDNNFSVELAAQNPELVEELGFGCKDCGIEMRCDVLACIGNITFIDSQAESETC